MRSDDYAKTTDMVRELTEKYEGIMATLRIVMSQLGELVNLKRRLEDAGESVPPDIDEALRKVEARLLKDRPVYH
jgi:hypothetical protein